MDNGAKFDFLGSQIQFITKISLKIMYEKFI